jgi:hypothetical protein
LRLDHKLDATVLVKLDHDGVESARRYDGERSGRNELSGLNGCLRQRERQNARAAFGMIHRTRVAGRHSKADGLPQSPEVSAGAMP